MAEPAAKPPLGGGAGVMVLSVFHGLANRLRAVAAGAALAEELGRELHLHWPVNAQVGAWLCVHGCAPFPASTELSAAPLPPVLASRLCWQLLERPLTRAPLAARSATRAGRSSSPHRRS